MKIYIFKIIKPCCRFNEFHTSAVIDYIHIFNTVCHICMYCICYIFACYLLNSFVWVIQSRTYFSVSGTVTSYLARWRLKAPTSRLFILPFFSGKNQRNHQSFASLAFVRGIHRWINRTKGPETRHKNFLEHLVICEKTNWTCGSDHVHSLTLESTRSGSVCDLMLNLSSSSIKADRGRTIGSWKYEN